MGQFLCRWKKKDNSLDMILPPPPEDDYQGPPDDTRPASDASQGMSTATGQYDFVTLTTVATQDPTRTG